MRRPLPPQSRSPPNPPRAPKAGPLAGPPGVRMGASVRDSNGITFDQGYKHPLAALGAPVDVPALSQIRPPVCFRCALPGQRAFDREACQQLIHFHVMGKSVGPDADCAQSLVKVAVSLMYNSLKSLRR